MNLQENSNCGLPKTSESLAGQTNPLVVVGTVAVDGVKTPFGHREKVFGGSASYFSYAASFFSPVGLVAVVGEDFPDEYRNVLGERPIDLSHLETMPGKTFHWKGEYREDLNVAHTLETELNVLLDFDPKLHFKNHPEYVFLANVDPDIQFRVLDQMDPAHVRFTACDTMNFWIQNKRESLLKVLARVDCVVLNDGEARQLTGEPNLIKAGQKIRDLGPGMVVIKKGEHGVLLLAQNHYFALPAYPLETLFDPTGAGDSFAGGMMGALAAFGEPDYDNMKKAIAIGSIVASFTVENFGLESLRSLTRTKIEERLALFRRITTF